MISQHHYHPKRFKLETRGRTEFCSRALSLQLVKGSRVNQLLEVILDLFAKRPAFFVLPVIIIKEQAQENSLARCQ